MTLVWIEHNGVECATIYSLDNNGPDLFHFIQHTQDYFRKLSFSK